MGRHFELDLRAKISPSQLFKVNYLITQKYSLNVDLNVIKRRKRRESASASVLRAPTNNSKQFWIKRRSKNKNKRSLQWRINSRKKYFFKGGAIKKNVRLVRWIKFSWCACVLYYRRTKLKMLRVDFKIKLPMPLTL